MNKLLEMADIFKRYSQTLDVHHSTLSKEEIQAKAAEWKLYIEKIKDSVPKRPGWGGKEGELILAALNKIIMNQTLTTDDIAKAYMDCYTNFRELDQYEFKKYLDSYFTYFVQG